MLKLHAGVSKKVGLPGFSSASASCTIEAELEFSNAARHGSPSLLLETVRVVTNLPGSVTRLDAPWRPSRIRNGGRRISSAPQTWIGVRQEREGIMSRTTGRRMPLIAAAMAACCLPALPVSPAHGGAPGNYFETVRDSARDGDLKVSIDSLFMFRTDDMSSVLMTDTFTRDTAFQTGQTDLGTIFGPMVNVTRDCASGWGGGFRYYSLIDGSYTSDQAASGGGWFTENFNGLQYDDLVQFNTSYSSTLHNFEFNLRRAIRPGMNVYLGYRFLELDEQFTIQSRNRLPQEPPIDSSSTSLSNQLHGGQIGAQIAVIQWSRFGLDVGGSTGLYNNFVRQGMLVTESGIDYAPQIIRGSQLAFVNDLNLTGTYRFTNHWSLRAGLQMLWLTDVALAPEQTQTNNFRTQTFAIDQGSDVFYFGGFTGLQYEF
jgi:hypothetical protein